jgi:hypothetical protein
LPLSELNWQTQEWEANNIVAERPTNSTKPNNIIASHTQADAWLWRVADRRRRRMLVRAQLGSRWPRLQRFAKLNLFFIYFIFIYLFSVLVPCIALICSFVILFFKILSQV